MPTNAVRSAEGRCVPFTKKEGDAHAAGGLPVRRALNTESASRRSAPSALPRGVKSPPRKGGPTTASRGAELRRERFRIAV
jgi:hypothetical protein